MAKVILLLLITVSTFSQFHRLNDRTDGFRLLYNPYGNTFESAIISTNPDLTTGYPIVPYDNFGARITAPQYIKFLHKSVLATQYDSLNLYLVFKNNGGTALQYIIGQQGAFTTAFQLKIETNILKWVSRGTTRNLDTISDANYHRLHLQLIGGNVTYRRDGSIRSTYSTVTIDTMTDMSNRALVIGDDYQLDAQGTSNIISNGGTANILVDSIYFYVENDTLIDVNFNNGVLMSSGRQWLVWANQDAHDFLFYNGTGGYTNMAFNYYYPDMIYIDGTRKDTNKYFQLPLNDPNGGGFRLHTGTEYARSTVNDIKVSPSGLTAIAIGIFSHTSDSTNLSSRNIALWDGNSWETVGDTGLQSSAFPYDGEWINDTAYCCSFVNGSVRGITIFNTVTGDNWTKQVDTVVVGMTIVRDTIYYLDRSRLRALNPFNMNVSTKYVFPESATNLSPNSAIGKGGDTIIVSAGLHVYWVRNGALLQTLDFNPWNAVDKYDIGGVWYDGIKRDSRGRDWFCGDYRGIGGVVTSSGSAIGYVQNGVYTKIGELGGGSGDCEAYAPSCLQGAFTLMSTSITEPFEGDIVITGTFRFINSTYTGNIALWNTSTIRAMDYGSAWTVWQGDTITIDGYKDMIFCGDGIEVNGMKSNGAWGRYLDEHFRALEPEVTMTIDNEVTPNDFPLSVSAEVFSKQQRQLEKRLIFKKNYNGTNDTVSLTQTDSVLNNLKAGWYSNNTGSVTGTYLDGDTSIVWIEAEDDYGNIGSSAIERVAVDAPDYPADVYAEWDYRDKVDSGVVNGTALSTWTDRVNGLILVGLTTNRPTLQSDGILFDTTDLMNVAVIGNLVSPTRGFTILVQMKVTDTNTASVQDVYHYAVTEALPTRTNRFGFRISTHATTTYRKIGTQYFDGVTATNKTFLTNWANHFNQFSVFIMYGDSVGRQDLRIRDSIAVNQGAPFGVNTNSTGFSLGNSETLGGMKNITIKRVIIWRRELSYTELVQARASAVARP